MALRIDEQRKTSGPRGGTSAPDLEGAVGGDSAEGNLIRAVYRPAADSRGSSAGTAHFHPPSVPAPKCAAPLSPRSVLCDVPVHLSI